MATVTDVVSALARKVKEGNIRWDACSWDILDEANGWILRDKNGCWFTLSGENGWLLLLLGENWSILSREQDETKELVDLLVAFSKGEPANMGAVLEQVLKSLDE